MRGIGTSVLCVDRVDLKGLGHIVYDLIGECTTATVFGSDLFPFPLIATPPYRVATTSQVLPRHCVDPLFRTLTTPIDPLVHDIVPGAPILASEWGEPLSTSMTKWSDKEVHRDAWQEVQFRRRVILTVHERTIYSGRSIHSTWL